MLEHVEEKDWEAIPGGVHRDRSMGAWLRDLCAEDLATLRSAEQVLSRLYEVGDARAMSEAGDAILPFLFEVFERGNPESRRAALRLLALAWSAGPDFIGETDPIPALDARVAYDCWCESQRYIRDRLDVLYAPLGFSNFDLGLAVIRALGTFEEQAMAHSPVLRAVFTSTKQADWKRAVLAAMDRLAPAIGAAERIAWLRLVAVLASEEEQGDGADEASALLARLYSPGDRQPALTDAQMRKARYNLEPAAQAWLQRLW